jgi:hypothetical protein
VLDHGQHRRHLLRHARTHHLRAVVVALPQGCAVAVADARDAGRVAVLVVGRAAQRADPAARDAADELLDRDVDVQDPANPLPRRGQGLVQDRRLAHRARKAVEDDPRPCGGTAQRLGHHADGDLVGDELAALHVLPRGLTQLGSRGERRSEQVARRQVHQAQLARKRLRLGPLAGPDRTDQQQDEARVVRARAPRPAGPIGHRMKPS